MTADRSVLWALYRDASCSDEALVLSGKLPVELARPPVAQKAQESGLESSFTLDSSRIQLVPALQHRIWELQNGMAPCEAVPVAAEDLTLPSKELGLEGTTLLYCKLQVDDQPTGIRTETWFDWKLQRAGEYRARGNEEFKQERYTDAVKLYKRALAWLEPPTDRADATLDSTVQYSSQELEHVNPVAIACHANMATCFSKLNRDGDVERCIKSASEALRLDAQHVKARYRRSQAYVSSKEFELALDDLHALTELEPDNKLFRTALGRAQAAKTQLRKKQQSAFARVFQ